jgi:hypothetical protein
MYLQFRRVIIEAHEIADTPYSAAYANGYARSINPHVPLPPIPPEWDNITLHERMAWESAAQRFCVAVLETRDRQSGVKGNGNKNPIVGRKGGRGTRQVPIDQDFGQ